MRINRLKTTMVSRRALIMGAAKMGALSLLCGRLYYLQVSQSDEYKNLAEGNRVRIFPTIPTRGKFFDRYGSVLAEGIKRYQLNFDSQSISQKESEEILDRLSEIIEIDLKLKQKILKKLTKRRRRGQSVLIKDYLSWQDVAKIEVNSAQFPGVFVSSPEVRNYPFGENTAHLIGYIGVLSQKEIQKNELYGPLYQHPDYRVGKTGLEKTMQERLAGKAGAKKVEVNARGTHVRELKSDGGIAGENISLTIDITLQEFVMETLRNKGGLDVEGASATVIDVKNGDILAMASVPSYDPNRFVKGISHDYWNSLITSLDSPLSNKATSLQYPPGSTFKIITALAGLEEKTVTAKTKIYCPGYYKLGGRRFHCWERRGHGHLTMEQALSKSCNVYFYSLSRKLGVDKIAEMARKFGLGEASGLGFSGEKKGIVPDKFWKKANIGKPWYIGETLNASIGQGYTLTTPLQLAIMTARLASGGKMVKPRIVLENNMGGFEMVEIDSGEKILLPSRNRSFEDIDVSQANLNIVLRGMNMVVNDSGGTVYKYRIRDDKYLMAGKTGTAQVSSKTFKYTPKKKSERYHALFIGYAPVYNPRYAISVVVEHGGYGSSVASPIGAKILHKVQKMESER